MRRIALLVLLLAASSCGDSGEARELTLYTHCGVLSATVDGKLWIADPPLTDGSGNPPRGWGVNSTRGTWRAGGDGASFRARSGKVARFRPARPGEPDPARGCE